MSVLNPKIRWVSAHGGTIPPGAIVGGMDNGEMQYVARALVGHSWIPGKLHPSHGGCFVSYDGNEVSKMSYQVLTTTAPKEALSWVKVSNNNIPENAIAGGNDPNGETMYIGRALHVGNLVIGKVHPSHRCCYVPYEHGEHSYRDYEILTVNELGKMLKIQKLAYPE